MLYAVNVQDQVLASPESCSSVLLLCSASMLYVRLTGFLQIDAHEEEIKSAEEKRHITDNDHEGSTRELKQKNEELNKMKVTVYFVRLK